MTNSTNAATSCKDAILRTVERFLSESRQPALLEPGEEPISITQGSFAIEPLQDHVVLQVWDERRNLSRRIVAVRESAAGRLELIAERFGKRRHSLVLFDQAVPRSAGTRRHAARMVFRERFRRFLRRHFPGWSVADLTTEADLEHTLSDVYPRAFLRQGGGGLAAIAASPESGSSAGCLSFGLIWLNYLRQREKQVTVEGLVLLLPDGQQHLTCLRLRHLNPRTARFLVYVYSEDGCEQIIDPRDHGNLNTRLEVCRTGISPSGAAAKLEERLSGLSEVQSVPLNDGCVSYQVHGLEFVRLSPGGAFFGLDRKRPALPENVEEICGLASHLARLRSPESSDKTHPLFTRCPEAWLASRVRSGLEIIDAGLLPSPVYGQVPAFAGGERGILDLLAVERSGRLAVLELKASMDLHLPLQALDYWMRVQVHADTGEFSPKGYFPGVHLTKEPPRLLLIAPALEFHPTTETMLRFFSPDIPVERVGVAMNWQRELKVAFRVQGPAKPGI